MIRPVRLSAKAVRQLRSLRRHITREGGKQRAEDYVDELVRYCDWLSLFPERGTRRDDLLPGLRIIGWRRRAAITFIVEPHEVVILGVFHGGQDVTFDA